MGQTSSTVQVANGFAHNLYVKVDVKAIRSLNSKSGTDLMAMAAANKTNETKGTSMDKDVIVPNGNISDPGFRLVPRGDVTIFHPAIEQNQESKAVYISSFYTDKKGKTIVLHDSTHVSAANARLIVTSDGGIVAAGETNPWVGHTNRKNHKPKATVKELYG